MTFVIKKKIPQTACISSGKQQTPPEHLDLIEQVGILQDEAMDRTKRIKILQLDLQPYTEKVKQLAKLVSKHAQQSGIDPDKLFNLSTDDFVLQVGKAGTVRTVVDVEQAMKKMGKKIFFQKCTIGLGVIDQYLTPEEREDVLKVERCLRGVKVLRRAQGQGNG